MTCSHLSRLLALCVIFCATRDVQGARDFEKKVALMLKEEPENPKCFVESRKDLTCFWEEDEERAGSVDQYSFTYTYQNENASSCPLSALPAAGGKRLFVCRLDRPQMFVQMDVRVRREETLIHSRSLFIELVFLLDPPANVTASSAGQGGQLNVSWVAPPLRYMDDSMMYEVSCEAAADGHAGKVVRTQASSQLVLRGLRPVTRYKVQVRVKLDGISYNGFWSAWSDPVFVETPPAELDLLIVSLTLIISFILIALSVTMLLSQRRLVKNKIWPVIPTPDSKFHGLFSVYGGDFKAWLGQTGGGLWSTPQSFYSEECPSPLEVLSELGPAPPPTAPGRKEEDGDAVRGLDEGEPSESGAPAPVERWTAAPHDPWLMDRLRELHRNQKSSPLESQDAYVTLSGDNHGDEGGHPDAALEEASPLEVLFARGKTASCESHSDLGSAPRSSGLGGLSSQSSFEDPNQRKEPGYTYMAVADSGVSMDYSPMSRGDDIGIVAISANEYENQIPGLRRPFRPSQHPDG
ncbi:erythropoietin receptor [Pseudoliparis swirei]|uniref:erythropoietin receptor n=1 Tax=Pseudoliparis swirei TaxID=2059687 RepID=UPI0024BE84A1|nr:erythropoietin receptor [Pseudoliparis swirei]